MNHPFPLVPSCQGIMPQSSVVGLNTPKPLTYEMLSVLQHIHRVSPPDVAQTLSSGEQK